jgi:hypothetical protein
MSSGDPESELTHGSPLGLLLFGLGGKARRQLSDTSLPYFIGLLLLTSFLGLFGLAVCLLLLLGSLLFSVGLKKSYICIETVSLNYKI